MKKGEAKTVKERVQRELGRLGRPLDQAPLIVDVLQDFLNDNPELLRELIVHSDEKFFRSLVEGTMSMVEDDDDDEFSKVPF